MRKSDSVRRARSRMVFAAGITTLLLAGSAKAQTFQISLGVRETNWTAPTTIGGNGGTNHIPTGLGASIEWVNLDGLTLVADGTWQQFTFNFGTDPVTPFAGTGPTFGTQANGILEGTTGTIEHIRIRNSSGETNGITMWIDDIVNTVSSNPIVISGFETTDVPPAAIDTEHIFQEPSFSGSTQSFLSDPFSSRSLVRNEQFHSGLQSDRATWTWNTSDPTSWLRLTTFNTPNQPNPAIDYSPGNSLSFWLRMDIAPPAQRWINTGSGNWDEPLNWGTGVVPNGVAQTANLLEDITGPAVITLNNPITVGTLRLQSDFGYTIIGGASNNALTFDGNAEDARIVNAQKGSHTISSPVTVSLGVGTSASMVFNVQRAQDVLTVSGDVTINITGIGAPTLTFQKTGPGRLDITNIETIDPVTQPTNLLVSGGTMRLLAGSGRTRTNALSIAGGAVPTARLDITNNPVVVDYATASPIATIKSQIAMAYNAGAWDGNGITSSQANSSQFSVGFAEASSLASIPAIFGTIDGTEAVLIRLTRYGDANLDGSVSLPDFNRLAANFGSTAADWSQGDFTYDSAVGLPDFNRLAGNFGLTAGPDGPTPADWAALAAAVPEPSSIAVASAIAVLMTIRRRS